MKEAAFGKPLGDQPKRPFAWIKTNPNRGVSPSVQVDTLEGMERKPGIKHGINTAPLLDKHYRSLVKAISWRVTGTLDTVLIAYLITGKVRWALSIGFVELFTKITLYYFHERLWNHFSFGRKHIPIDYQI